MIVTEKLTGWETTRLSNHFILLDFLADREVYRPYDGSQPLAFHDTWNSEHEALAKGLCNDLLEPLMADECVGPISVADAFVPPALRTRHRMRGHRWTEDEATVDIAPYKLVDNKGTDSALKNAVLSMETIKKYCRHINNYPETEFLCVTFTAESTGCKWERNPRKKRSLRAHHVRVGRFFNLLDFCRNGWAIENGVDLVPRCAEKDRALDYSGAVPEETAARSFAAALDPLVEQVGRISVVRGIETDGFASDKHADLHCWDKDGPWRLVFVLPQGTDPEETRDILASQSHVQDIQVFWHASISWAVALIVNWADYDSPRGLRLPPV